GSLLLGLYDDGGKLHHVGVTSSFTAAKRKDLVGELAPLREGAADAHPWREWAQWTGDQRMPGASSRWNRGKDLSWEPLRIERVCEVAYDHLQGDRFRHATTFLRWRPDHGAQALRARSRGRVLLPEAGAGVAAALDRGGGAEVPFRPDGPRSGAAGRRAAGLDHQPRLPRSPSAPGARRGPRPSRRAARRSGSRPRRSLGAGARGRAARARGAPGARTHRLAEDVGLARDPRQRPDRAALDLPGGARRRARAGARGGRSEEHTSELQ